MPRQIVTFQYKLNNRQFKRRLDCCHLVAFTVSFACLVSISIITYISGLKQSYQSLQFSSQCNELCQQFLKSEWFPLQAVLPLEDMNVSLANFQLVMNPEYKYYACDVVKITTNFATVLFLRLPSNVLDQRDSKFRLPQTSEGFPVKITMNQQNILTVSDQEAYIIQENETVSISVQKQSGANIQLESMIAIREIEFHEYFTDHCTAVQNGTDRTLLAAKSLVAVAPGPEFSLEPFVFDFVGQTTELDSKFWAVLSLGGASVLTLIECTFYFCRQRKKQTEERLIMSDVVDYVDEALNETQ